MELSVENGQLDAVHQDMNKLLEMGKANPGLKAMLQSPVIHSDKKANVLKALFAKPASPLTLVFLNLLSQKGRENAAMAIAQDFHKKYNIHKGIQEADLVTTFAIDDELRNTFIGLVKEISGKDRVELNEKIDPEIIGGYVLTVDDRQVDESLDSKLKMLQIRFTQNLYEKRY
jgi:F-type H+-transporting ATPase subunit delta